MMLQTARRDSRDVDFFPRGSSGSGSREKRKGGEKGANGTSIAGGVPADRSKPPSYSRDRKT